MERFAEVIAELAHADDEHPDVSLKHDSEWYLSFGRSGVLIYENAEAATGGARHMKGVPPARVVELWTALARGDLAEIEQQPWIAGYG